MCARRRKEPGGWRTNRHERARIAKQPAPAVQSVAPRMGARLPTSRKAPVARPGRDETVRTDADLRSELLSLPGEFAGAGSEESALQEHVCQIGRASCRERV